MKIIIKDGNFFEGSKSIIDLRSVYLCLKEIMDSVVGFISKFVRKTNVLDLNTNS